ncbi:MAG: IPT/TIG domain-containing protein [Myxococcales bacterium]|nr:IPT/TIG domain-containing protein [Myxococcales bacterium]
MRNARLGLLLAGWLSFGCGANSAADLGFFVLRLQAQGVPTNATLLEPQVSVLSDGWNSAASIAPADLSMLTKRDPVTVILRVPVQDAGQRVAAAVRVLDDKKQMLAVGGAQLALTRDSTLPVALVESIDARSQALQLAKVVPSQLTSGKVVTLYGWGFAASDEVTVGGQKVQSVQWQSSVELVVTMPQSLARGPATITVSHVGGSSDTRTDLATVE